MTSDLWVLAMVYSIARCCSCQIPRLVYLVELKFLSFFGKYLIYHFDLLVYFFCLFCLFGFYYRRVFLYFCLFCMCIAYRPCRDYGTSVILLWWSIHCTFTKVLNLLYSLFLFINTKPNLPRKVSSLFPLFPTHLLRPLRSHREEGKKKKRRKSALGRRVKPQHSTDSEMFSHYFW